MSSRDSAPEWQLGAEIMTLALEQPTQLARDPTTVSRVCAPDGCT